ncbi:MAG: tetratricopeptide repeat protein [Candidatus Paceibacterota bacterium]
MRNQTLIIAMSMFAGFLVLAANIYTTQSVDSLFGNITTGRNQDAAKELLRRVSETGRFNQQLAYFISMFGDNFQDELLEVQHERLQKITEYQKLLEINPHSTTALVNISLLYYENNNLKQSKAYYARARAIDPWIEIEELEALGIN